MCSFAGLSACLAAFAVALTPSLSAASSSGASGTAKKPNFLWILIEDTGPTGYSCYGEQPAAYTPNIDAFARQGVRYDRFYTTAPVCSPSRSGFNTGMYATAIGAHQHRTMGKQPLPEGVRTLSSWLRGAGYYTANIRTFPEGVSFRGAGKTDWNFIPGDAPFEGDQWSELRSRQPFYAQINFQETHRTFHGEKRADPKAIKLPPYYPDHPVIRKDYAEYLDSATAVDAKIAKVLALLEQDGLADNTFVIVMGDNGEAHIRGKQFLYEEGLRVPMMVRWPKGLPAPKHYSVGKVDTRLLEAIDVAPTLLSLAGVPLPPKMQGRPFLGDQVAAPKRYVFGARDRCDETSMRLRSVRDERYRYIRTFTPEVPFFAPNAYKEKQYPAWTLVPQLYREGKLTPVQAMLCAPRQPEEQLFDMQADPYQIQNLVDSKKPEHAAALARLRAALEDWVIASDDKGRFPEVNAPRTPDEAAGAPSAAKSDKKKKRQQKQQQE